MASEWERQAKEWKGKQTVQRGVFERGAEAACWRREAVFTRLAERAESYHLQLLAHERLEL